MAIKFQQETHVVMIKEVTLPYWIELAILGEKINAIKALREASRIDGFGEVPLSDVVSLRHCKLIVEDIMGKVVSLGER